MRRISRWMLFALFLIWLSWIALTPAWGETIRVGLLQRPPIGELALFSQYTANSIKMALEDIHRQGILGNGKRIELIVQDIPLEPKQIQAVVNHLIFREGVSMLITSVPDLAAFQIAALAQSRKIPLLVHVAPADRITEQGWEYVFRLNPPTSEYHNGLLHFLGMVVKPKTFAYLYVEGPLDPLRAERFDNERNAGMELVFLHRYLKNTTDFRPILKQMKEKKPDVIYMISYPKDAVLLLRQCKELDIHPKLFAGFGAFALPEFYQLAGDAANYVYATSLWNPFLPYPGVKDYRDRYRKRYGTLPDYQGAVAYAALQVVADACRRARSIRPDDIREALGSTDMITILGRVKFVSYGRKMQQNRLPSYLIQWMDGKPRTVWPPRLASHQYVYPVPRSNKGSLANIRSKFH